MVNLTKAPKVNLTKAGASRWVVDITKFYGLRSNSLDMLQGTFAIRDEVHRNNLVMLGAVLNVGFSVTGGTR